MSPPYAKAFSARAYHLVEDLVEPSKSEAFSKPGEGERAFRIAVGWVRGSSPEHVTFATL